MAGSVLGNYAEQIVETVWEPLLLLDREARVRLANASFYRVFETSPEDTLGVELQHLGNGEWNVPALTELVAAVMAKGETFNDYVLDHDFPRIGRRVMRLNARRLTGLVDGEIVALLAIEDITEQEHVAATLRWHARELDRSNQELERFASVASHDLQEPLRKIRSYGDLLAANHAAELSPEARDHLSRMVAASERMQRLINDLLTLSRISTQPRQPVRIDLAAVVHDVLIDLDMRIREQRAEVAVGDLPALEADPLRMRQLFQNLLANSLKFARPDTPPRITIGTREADTASLADLQTDSATLNGDHLIVVEDNGIGFEQKYAETIFAPFQRLHGRAVYDGSGVGLAICRRIVEQHGGWITARSVPGTGTRFFIALPSRQLTSNTQVK